MASIGTLENRRSAPSRRLRMGALAVLSVGAVLLAAAVPGVADARSTIRGTMRLGGTTHSVSIAGTTGAKMAGTVHYGVTQRLCPRPTRTQLACMAERLKRVSQTAPGARRFIAPSVALGPAGGFSPANLSTAYGYDPTSATGATQTVAIVDAYDDPDALTELNTFDANYGLPAETSKSFRKVNQTGATSPLPAADSGWAGEIALDVQAVRAVCNKCKIVLIEAKSATANNLATAVNTGASMHATEISNSYGGPEVSGVPSTLPAAYNHPGIVITASTGDHGWYDWDYANDGQWSDNAPNTPAAYPTVVAVGGTALSLDTGSLRTVESVWNENGADDQTGLALGDMGASGGGCSFIYQAEPWQSAVTGYDQTGCGSNRLAGDVAALADPYTGFDIYSGGSWVTVGGTSLASPLVAAMWALAGGSGGVKYPAQSLYDHLAFTPSDLYDVTTGGNSFCAGDSTANCSAAVDTLTAGATGSPNNLANGNSNYGGGWAGLLDCGYDYGGAETTIAQNTQCNAVSGYDGPTGVGAPNGLNAFTSMQSSVAMTAPSFIKQGRAATFKASGFTDPVAGTTLDHYHWAWGDGHSTNTTSASVTHTFAKGKPKVTLTAIDNLGRTSFAVSKSYVIGYAPTATLSGPTKVHAKKRYTWSTKAHDPNTGGKITGYVWRIGSTRVGTSSSLHHTFGKLGYYKLSITVSDNSGLKTKKTITVHVVR